MSANVEELSYEQLCGQVSNSIRSEATEHSKRKVFDLAELCDHLEAAAAEHERKAEEQARQGVREITEKHREKQQALAKRFESYTSAEDEEHIREMEMEIAAAKSKCEIEIKEKYARKYGNRSWNDSGLEEKKAFISRLRSR